MDVSKAFDTLNHELLIAKLSAYGFTNESLKLIESCLTNWRHRTKVNESESFSKWAELLQRVSLLYKSIITIITFEQKLVWQIFWNLISKGYLQYKQIKKLSLDKLVLNLCKKNGWKLSVFASLSRYAQSFSPNESFHRGAILLLSVSLAVLWKNIE